MHPIKFNILLVLVLLHLTVLDSNAQVGATSNIFIKNLSNVKLVDDTTAVSCSGQEIWLFYKGCAANDVVNWSTGESGDSIKITSQNIIQAFCQSNDVTFSPKYYVYFDNQPVAPTITKQNLSPKYTCLSSTSFNLYASCQGFRPSAVWQDNSSGLLFPSNQNGVYSAKCINQCGTSDLGSEYQVSDAPSYSNATVNSTGESICGLNPLILSTNYPDIDNDSLKYFFNILWSNGSTETSITVTEGGEYYYSLTKINCGDEIFSNSFHVINGVNPPIINPTNISPLAINGDSINICEFENFTLVASGCEGGTVNWNNGQTGNSITVTDVGTFSATCNKACGLSPNSNTIIVFNSNDCFLNPPLLKANNYNVCEKIPNVTVVGNCLGSKITWINPSNATGDSINVQAGTYTAICEIRGVKSQQASITIGTKTSPTAPTLTSSKILLCFQEYADLTATGCQGKLTWSHDTTSLTSIKVNKAGEYTAICSDECGPSVLSNKIVLTSYSQPNPPIIEMQTLPNCKADSALLIAKNCEVGSKTYWSNGEIKDSILVGPGNYFAICQNICGNSLNSNAISINVGANVAPPLVSTSDSLICGSEKALLVAIGCEGGSTSWSNGMVGDTISVSDGTYSAKCVQLCGESFFSKSVQIFRVFTPIAPTIRTQKTLICDTDSTIIYSTGCSTGATIWSDSLGTGDSLILKGEFFGLSYGKLITAVCKSECGTSSISNSIFVTFDTFPHKPSITSNKNIICGAESATLTVTGCSGAGIDWLDSNDIGSIRQVSSGSYTAVCTTSCGTSENSNTLTISSGLLPEKPIISTNVLSLCPFEKATLTATSCIDGTIVWSNGANGTTIQIGTGSYSARCVNSCGSSIPSDTINIVLNTALNPPVISSNFPSVCGTQTVIISGTVCVDGTISWSNGQTGASINVGQGNYTAVCISPCGTSGQSNTITISTIDKPNPPVLTTDVSTICGNQIATITATGCEGGQIGWNEGPAGNNFSTQGHVGNHIMARCFTSCGFSDSSNVIIINAGIQAPPIISKTVDSLCAFQKTTISAINCTNGTLNWSTGETGASISVGPGSYYATCTGDCGTSDSSNVLTIFTKPIPDAPIITSNFASVCGDQKAILSASGCENGILTWSNAQIGRTISIGAGTYTATCTEMCGVSVSSNPLTISIGTITNPPTISASKISICSLETTIITSSGCDGGLVIWSTGDTLASINKGIGTYFAKCLTACGSSVYSDTITISEKPLPLAPVISASKTQVCGDYAKLTAAGCLDGIITWSNSFVGSTTNVNAGTYTATCTNACGVSQPSNSIAITNGQLPTVPNVSADKLIVCGTEKATLSSSGCTVGTLKWSNGETTNTILVGSGAYTAHCENGCGSSGNSTTFIISQGPIPSAPLIVSNKAILCGIEKATLTASGCIGGTITWSGGLGVGTSKTVGAGTYSSTCTTACGTSSVSNSVAISVSVSPSAPIIAVSKTIVCPGDSATLTVNGCNDFIQWSNGMTINPIKIGSGGVYSATCTNACGTSTTSNLVQITQSNNPIVPIITVDKQIIFQGDTAKATVSNCNGTVQWSNGKIGQSIGFVQQGTYWAKCSNICGISEADTVIITLAPDSLKPIVAASKVVVAPKQMATLSFSNCTGNVLWSNGMTANTITVDPGTYSMSCNTLAGAYFSDPIVILEACSNICVNIGVKKLF